MDACHGLVVNPGLLGAQRVGVTVHRAVSRVLVLAHARLTWRVHAAQVCHHTQTLVVGAASYAELVVGRSGVTRGARGERVGHGRRWRD